eukprot:267850_1
MSELTASQKVLVQRIKEDEIEYICLELCDSYCRSFGKMIHASYLQNYLLHGYSCPPIYTVAINHSELEMDDTLKTGNVKFVLDIETYKKLPSSLCIKTYNKTKPAKMARIMMHPSKHPVKQLDPRCICKNALSILKDEFGYNLFSAFEHEFQLFKPSNAKDNALIPCWNGTPFMSNLELLSNGYGAFIIECERTLSAMDIKLESMHFEAAPGGLELTMKPAMGIQSADNSYFYKQTVKQIAKNHELRALFAAAPQCDNTEMAGNGAHFNHSLWDSDGKNLFFDAKTSDKLSLIGKYWIGGILKHLKGMTAFCVPTVNCFRRTNGKENWSPCNGSYGFDNRLCLIRIKMDNYNPKGCYFEYRLPSSASNPYYVITAVIIAGIDGIRNKILPKYNPHKHIDGDPNLDGKFEKIPSNLEDALIELEKDQIMCNAFGEWFISLYCKVKRTEIDLVGKFTKAFGDRNKAEKFLFSKL